MPTHRMAADAVAAKVERERLPDQRGELVQNVAAHPVIGGPRGLRRVEVKAGTEPDVPALFVRNPGSARAGVGGEEGEPEPGAGGAIFPLVGDIGMAAGEAREPGHERHRALLGSGREEQREGHLGSRRHAVVRADQLAPAVAAGLAGDFERHCCGR